MYTIPSSFLSVNDMLTPRWSTISARIYLITYTVLEVSHMTLVVVYLYAHMVAGYMYIYILACICTCASTWISLVSFNGSC